MERGAILLGMSRAFTDVAPVDLILQRRPFKGLRTLFERRGGGAGSPWGEKDQAQ